MSELRPGVSLSNVLANAVTRASEVLSALADEDDEAARRGSDERRHDSVMTTQARVSAGELCRAASMLVEIDRRAAAWEIPEVRLASSDARATDEELFQGVAESLAVARAFGGTAAMPMTVSAERRRLDKALVALLEATEELHDLLMRWPGGPLLQPVEPAAVTPPAPAQPVVSPAFRPVAPQQAHGAHRREEPAADHPARREPVAEAEPQPGRRRPWWGWNVEETSEHPS